MAALRCRCASTHFGEIQLATGSIGISPLITAHPPIFQHRSVRTSNWCYPSFILAMIRSHVFGSRGNDLLTFALRQRQNSPIKTRFRVGSGYNSLTINEPLPLSRRLILQQARGQFPSHCLSAYGFMFYFTPLRGFFSPFPRGTISLSVTQEYLALRGGPR